MSFDPDLDSDLEAEVQRQKTALVYRNAGIAQAVHIVNATLLAFVNVTLHAPARVAFSWWCMVVTIAVGRFLLARRFLALAPGAADAVVWQRRYTGGTAMLAAAWGSATVLFMWHAPESAILFTGLVLVGMVAGAIPILAPVPTAFRVFVALVSVPMSVVVFLQADSALHWALGLMSLVFLAAMVASARYLNTTLSMAIRLGQEQGRLAGHLQQARATAEAALSEQGKLIESQRLLTEAAERSHASSQEQKQFLSAILENEPECVTVAESDGTLLQVNNAGLSMLEVDGVEEINAIGWMEFLLPEHRPAFMDLTRRVFAGETGVLAFQIQGKRGTRSWLEIHAAPLRDSTGTITHLLGVTRNVTRKREAEQRLALSLRGADLALSDWHIPSDALIFGEGWTNLLGYQPEALHPHVSTLAGLVCHEDMPRVRQAVIRHLKSETPYLEVEARMRHADGRWIWVLVRGMAVERTIDGRAVRVSGTAMDITARKLAEAEITRLSQWNELLLNSAGDGIYGIGQDGICTFVNPAALDILGFSKEEVLGTDTHELFHHHHQDGSPYPREECPIQLTLQDGIRREIEDAFVRKNGRPFPIHLTVTPMHEHGRPVGMVAVFQDISRRKAMELELKRLATTDPLTGVANRRHLMEQLELELSRVKRFGLPSAFLMVDIDHFKRVNDTHGHAAGDAVLTHLAEISQTLLRRIDLFGRLGGEEFGILLPGADEAGAWQFADRFRNHIAQAPLQSGDSEIPVTVSIGVAQFSPDDASPESIMVRADAALYRAKEGGRNRVEVG